jgi:hypothetical protein
MTKLQRVVHWAIVLNLTTGFLAAIYMVFVVFAPEGGTGPLLGRAREIPLDFFVRRRMYALEAWLTFGFLAIYLGLTSLRPAPPPAASADDPRPTDRA